MNASLAERFQDVNPDVSISTPDNSNVVDFYDYSLSDQDHTIVAHQKRPSALDPFQAYHNLIPLEAADGDNSYIDNVGHTGAVNAFTNIDSYRPLVNALGYSWSTEQYQEGDAQRTWVEFTYPTVDRLNQVLDEISPQDGLRFEPYDGGYYSAIEFAEALVRDKVLIAEEQPYQVHDHAAFHALGYIGLHGRFLEDFQQLAATNLESHKADLALLTAAGLVHEEDATKFLLPSKEILRAVLKNLDAFSNVAAEKIFDSSKRHPIPGKAWVNYDVQGTYHMGGNLSREVLPFPNPIVRIPETAQRYAYDIEQRYDQLTKKADALILVSS